MAKYRIQWKKSIVFLKIIILLGSEQQMLQELSFCRNSSSSSSSSDYCLGLSIERCKEPIVVFKILFLLLLLHKDSHFGGTKPKRKLANLCTHIGPGEKCYILKSPYTTSTKTWGRSCPFWGLTDPVLVRLITAMKIGRPV